MRFVYATDMHLRASTPIGRKDPDFLETIMRKLWGMVTWGMNNGIDAVLCGADIFDSHTPSLRAIYRFIHLLQTTQMKWYSTIGNHDVYGYNYSTPSSVLHMLQEAMPDLFHLLPNSWEEGVLKVGDTRIAGLPCAKEWTDRLPGAMVRLEGQADIVVAHLMITNQEAPFEHMRACDVPLTVPLMLTGDFHQPVGFQDKNGHLLINPGAISRLTRSKADMERQPMYAVIEQDRSNVQFMCPPYDPNPWLDSDKDTQEDVRIAEFVRQIGALTTRDLKGFSIRQIVELAAAQGKCPPEVLDYALGKLMGVQSHG